MNEIEFNLLRPPIVEAVVEIECDMPPGQQLISLEAPARSAFVDRYPKFRTQFVQEHKIETKTGESPKMSVRHDVQGFQFLQEDERQLVQVRVQGFSFNRLSPYSSLDEYLPEIERTWGLFAAFAAPEQIRRIRLRYINRILIPFGKGNIQLDDYLKVGPKLPDEDKLMFIGFLNQHVAEEVGTGNQVNILLTTQPTENGTLPLIFDNCVTSVSPEDPINWERIAKKIQELRSLKNRIFKNTLTEKCLSLFQQP